MATSDTIKNYAAYFRRSKESNYDVWSEQLGGDVESNAAEVFAYMGYEIGLATMVDIETGRCVAYGIYDGNELVNFEKEVPLT